MSSLIVRNLDETLIKALKARAVRHHRSTEAEHRAILAEVLSNPKRKTLAEALLDIPNVGSDEDFLRVNAETKTSDVFD
jgi:antitoxin FitA